MNIINPSQGRMDDNPNETISTAPYYGTADVSSNSAPSSISEQNSNSRSNTQTNTPTTQREPSPQRSTSVADDDSRFAEEVAVSLANDKDKDADKLDEDPAVPDEFEPNKIRPSRSTITLDNADLNS